MNMTTFKAMLDRYCELAYTNEYIFGFADRGNIYMIIVNHDVLPFVTTLDKVSSNRGGGYSLRFKPTRSQKELLKQNGFTILCTEEYFNDMYKNSKYNRGEVFEKIVTEYFGQEWTKDNVPFTKDGDITVDGIAYQIKFDKATFCTEQSLRNLQA